MEKIMFKTTLVLLLLFSSLVTFSDIAPPEVTGKKRVSVCNKIPTVPNYLVILSISSGPGGGVRSINEIDPKSCLPSSGNSPSYSTIVRFMKKEEFIALGEQTILEKLQDNQSKLWGTGLYLSAGGVSGRMPFEVLLDEEDNTKSITINWEVIDKVEGENKKIRLKKINELRT